MLDELLQKAAKVRMAIFDVDGVLTNGGLVLMDDGSECKVFNVKDGQGLVMLRESGVELAIITGRSSRVVAERMSALGVAYVYQGQSNKMQAFEEILQKSGLEADQIAYMGDDLPDLPVMRRVGLAGTPADAYGLVVQHADWVSHEAGGRGAVREFCELILEGRGELDSILNSYLD